MNQCNLTQTRDQPRFSILVPLEGDRGDLLACLQQWRTQRFPRDQFEVLLLSQRADAANDQGRALSDRFLCAEGGNLSKVYDVGARGARGEFLVFTESHCVPEPDFLEQLDLHLRSTGQVGACCRIIPVCDNALARVDALLTEEGYAVFRQEGDWRKFNVQAVALSRRAYLAVGGLAHRYDRYAEMLLAATLRDRGLTMGYAAGASVRHRFRTGLRGVLMDIEAYVAGESLYRWEHPGASRVGHTFIPEFTHEEEKSELHWELCRVLAAEWFRRGRRCERQVLRQHAGRWLRGGARARWWAALASQAAILRCHFWRWREARLERAYRRVWTAASQWSRLRFLRRRPQPPATPVADGSLDITELAEHDMLGLHALEQHRGESFRWTGRAAVLRLPLGANTREVVLATRGLRHDPELTVFIQGRRLDASAVHVEPNVIRLVVPGCAASRDSCLILLCNPLLPWLHGADDRRELGIPIFSICWQAFVSAGARDLASFAA